MDQRGTGKRYIVFVMVLTLILWVAVFLTLSRNQDNLAGHGFGQFRINVTTVLRAVQEMGTEGKVCRGAEPRCNAGLVCVSNTCTRIGVMYPFFITNATIKVADITRIGGKEPLVKDLFAQPANPGALGGACREIAPFCNQGLICKNRKCAPDLLHQLPQTGDELVKDPASALETEEQRRERQRRESEAHFFEQQREADRTRRRNACQEEYAQFLENGRTDTKCSACFEFNITDPDCCCKDPATVPGITPEALQASCQALPRPMVCPRIIDIEPPPLRFDDPNREICESPNPNDVVPEGAYFYDIEGGRHIDVCQDETHVRHIACFEEEITEQITACPGDTICEAGRCGGNEVFICTDDDPRNNVHREGHLTYRSNRQSDYCDSNSYNLLTQYQCRPRRNIGCDEIGNCDFTLSQQDVCDLFCYNGQCAEPADFDLDFIDPDDVEFTCEDSDGGDDRLVKGNVKVRVRYEVLGIEVLDEVIREADDSCAYNREVEENGEIVWCRDTSRVSEMTCVERFGVPFLEYNSVRCPEGTACFNGACRPEETLYCTDTDEGDNREVHGTITTGIRDSEESYMDGDFCGIDTCEETFCRGLADCRVGYQKPEGAVNEDAWHMWDIRQLFGFDDEIPMHGACIDYDFGNYPFIGGYVEDEEQGIHNDQCINDNTLREMTCENDQMHEAVTPCELGCRAGNQQGSIVTQYDHCIACNNDDDCGDGQWCDGFNNRCAEREIGEVPN